MKDYGEAETWLKKTIELKPPFESAWTELAEIYDIQHKDQKVISTYKKFMELFPGRADVGLRLARFYIKKQKYADASALLENLLKMDQVNREMRREIRLTLGASYIIDHKQIDKAIARIPERVK